MERNCPNNRGRHGVSRGRDFTFDVARRGRREYSLHAKASPCPILCSGGEDGGEERACGSGGEEQVCGTICRRIALSTSPGFYLFSCFYLLFLFLLLLLSSFSCHLCGLRFRVQMPFLLRGNNILHIFILHAEVIEMGVTPSPQN